MGITWAGKMAMRARWAAISLCDWMDYRRHRARFRASTRNGLIHRIEKPVGHRARHVFEVGDGGNVLTTFEMHQRWTIVTRLYPPKLTSLLDIGCCRGWFIVKAAHLPECERAMGVDVVPEFIAEANEGKRLLKLDKARFEYAFLNDLEADPAKYGLPYQTILIINTYHYMYWGSTYCPAHWPDQDYLLRTLAAMCTDRIIFMSPLDVSECPSDISERARQHPEWAVGYTTEQFLKTAGRYFDVSLETCLGVRPLYLLMKKKEGAGTRIEMA